LWQPPDHEEFPLALVFVPKIVFFFVPICSDDRPWPECVYRYWLAMLVLAFGQISDPCWSIKAAGADVETFTVWVVFVCDTVCVRITFNDVEIRCCTKLFCPADACFDCVSAICHALLLLLLSRTITAVLLCGSHSARKNPQGRVAATP
jgi:hypothetical protein